MDRKNYLFAFLANILNAGFAWLLLLVIVRLGSNIEAGYFGIAQAISLPIHLFFTLKIRTIQVSDIEKRFTDADYIFSRLLLAIVSFFVTVIFSYFFYYKNSDLMLVISALALNYSVAIFRENFISIVQLNFRNDLLFYTNLIQNLISFLIFIACYYYSKQLGLSLIIMSLIKILLLYVDSVLAKQFIDHKLIVIFREAKNHFKSNVGLILLALPLGITASMSALFNSIPRFYLENYLGLAEVGVFTAITSLVFALNLFVSPFTQVMLPILVKVYHENPKILSKLIIKHLGILSVVSMIGLIGTKILGVFILEILFGKSYLSYTSELFWAMVSAVCLIYFNYANLLLNVKKIYVPQLWIYAFCLLAELVACLFFIPIHKVNGAIFSNIICFGLGFIFSLLYFSFYKTRINYA